MADEERPIIIKRIKKVAGGHHGGAWKVAYADFVTAMMAFFLLLWLLNVTTSEQKEGIADYFSPNAVSVSASGAGGVLGGRIITEEEANMISNPTSILTITENPSGTTTNEETEISKEEFEKLKEEQEQKDFEKAQAEIKAAIEDNPELKELGNNIIIDMTPEGLRIQLVDKESYSMFPSGSARMNDKTRELMKKITQVIGKMPNQVAIAGHTDSAQFATGAGYTNWELSADRANAARRQFIDSGMPASRINRVMGKADTEHLFADPMDPRNRRLSIILLKDSVVKGAQDYIRKTREAVEKGGGSITPPRPSGAPSNRSSVTDEYR